MRRREIIQTPDVVQRPVNTSIGRLATQYKTLSDRVSMTLGQQKGA